LSTLWCGPLRGGAARPASCPARVTPRWTRRRSGSSARSRSGSALEVEDERELRALLARVQLHLAAGAAEAAGAAGDREGAVLCVEERSLDRDLAAVERRP